MTDKELKKLSKAELLEMLLDEGRELETLREENARLSEELALSQETLEKTLTLDGAITRLEACAAAMDQMPELKTVLTRLEREKTEPRPQTAAEASAPQKTVPQAPQSQKPSMTVEFIQKRKGKKKK